MAITEAQGCVTRSSCLLIFNLLLITQAKADFFGYYALPTGILFQSCSSRDGCNSLSAPDGNWTLTISSDTDGSVSTPDGGGSTVLTGGNSGSGLPGTTDFLIAAPAAGVVAFDWSYTSLNPFLGDNYAGYLLNNNFVQFVQNDGLGDDLNGSVTFSVTLGDSFGFRVGTMDNTFEPGVLTVADFRAPAPVPEPCTASLLVAVIALTLAGRRWRSSE